MEEFQRHATALAPNVEPIPPKIAVKRGGAR
jgi:hypothetical protein